MKACLLFLCLGSFWIMRAQDHEADSLIAKALEKGFLQTAHRQYQLYRQDSALHPSQAAAFNASRILFISYYDNADTARAILQDFEHGLKPEKIIERHKLKLHDDWDYAYALEPLFVKQYFNKVCFPTHFRLTREDQVFENRQHFTSYKQIKANTFFYNLDGNEVQLMYFTEAYRPHTLSPMLSDALHYYSTLTKSQEVLYQPLYRLPADTASVDARRISDAWDLFPGQTVRPKEPNSKDSLARQAYQKEKQAYDKAFDSWQKSREQAFDARLKADPALKKAFDNYQAFLTKYPVSVRSTAGRLAADRLHLPGRINMRYGRRRSAMYYDAFNSFIRPAIEANDYPLFARSFFYLRLFKAEKQLDSLKTDFYGSRRQMFLGALAATLLKSPELFERQSGAGLMVVSDQEKRQVMSMIEAWLGSKPADELMLYYMAYLYQDLSGDLNVPKDETDYDEKLKAWLKPSRQIYYWLFNEEPEEQ